MALTITATDVELTKPVNVAFNETFLRRARQNLPYFMGTQPGRLDRQVGTSTIKWRRIEQEVPSTTALAELNTTATFMMGRNADTPTFTDITATVQKFGQFYIVNEEVDLFNPAGTTRELVGVLGESAGRSLNQLQRNVAEDNLTAVFAGAVASAGAVTSAITAGSLQLAAVDLWTNAARTFTPITAGSQNVGTSALLPAFWAITHPHVAHDIAGLSGFVSVQNYVGQTRTAPGEFGFFSRAGVGIRFIASQDATIDAGAGGSTSGTSLRGTSALVDLYNTVIYGQDALGSVGLGQSMTDGAFEAGDDTGDWEIIIHDRGSGGIGDPFNEVATMAWKAFHAGAVLNSDWGRNIISGATDVTAA